MTQEPVPLEREDVLQLKRAVTLGIGHGKAKKVVSYEKGTCFNARSETATRCPMTSSRPTFSSPAGSGADDRAGRGRHPGGAEHRRPPGDVRPFARFNEWTEIDSAFEGPRFMERFAPGAFAQTLSELTPKVLFQHGHDPQVGNKPLGRPSVLKRTARAPPMRCRSTRACPT